MEAIFGVMSAFVLVMLGVGLAAFVFWLKMLIAAIRNDYEHKGVWILILFLFNIPGAFVFYFIPYHQIKAKKITAKSASHE